MVSFLARRGTFAALLSLSAVSVLACSSSDDPQPQDPAPAGGNTPPSSDGTGAQPSTTGGTTPTPTPAPTTPPPSTTGGTTTPPPADEAKSKLRVVHASPDAPAVDVWAKGVDKPLIAGLAYGAASPYLELAAGTYEVELRAAPSKATDPVAYATGPLTIPGGATITAVAAGLLGSKNAADAFRVLPVVEGFSKAAKGTAVVRIVHASADAPTVDLDVGNDDPTKPELKGLARFASTAGEGVALPAGAALQVGIAAGGKRVTAFTTPKLPDGGELFVIATGLLGRSNPKAAFSLLAVGPDGAIGFIGQNPVVYALHASPDAPEVDVFAGSAELVDKLGYGQLSANVQVPPGSYDLSFFGHSAGSARPAGAAVKTITTPALAAGGRYLAVATGFLAPKGSEQAFQLVPFVDAFDDLQPTKGVVRVIHASPDAPAVDIGVAKPASIDPVLIKGLAFPTATPGAGLALDPATYPLGVTPAGANTTVVARFNVPVAAGVRAFVVAAGSLSRKDAKPFGLFVVNTAATPWSVGTLSPQ